MDIWSEIWACSTQLPVFQLSGSIFTVLTPAPVDKLVVSVTKIITFSCHRSAMSDRSNNIVTPETSVFNGLYFTEPNELAFPAPDREAPKAGEGSLDMLRLHFHPDTYSLHPAYIPITALATVSSGSNLGALGQWFRNYSGHIQTSQCSQGPEDQDHSLIYMAPAR